MKNVLKALLVAAIVVAAIVAVIYVILGVVLDQFKPPRTARSTAGYAVADSFSAASVVLRGDDTVATIGRRMRWQGQPSSTILAGSFRSPRDARRTAGDTLLVGVIEPVRGEDVAANQTSARAGR